MQQRVPQDNLWAELVSAGYGIKAGIHGIHGIRTVSGTVSIASCVVSMVSGGKKIDIQSILFFSFFPPDTTDTTQIAVDTSPDTVQIPRIPSPDTFWSVWKSVSDGMHLLTASETGSGT